MLAWPLMRNNIVREDLDSLIEYLKGNDPMLTQAGNVRAFEKEWCEWLGVKHSVFVNSGSSANLITMAALRELRGAGQVIVPTLTWVSDIASVLQNGFEPVFVDIDERTLGMDVDAVLKKITKKTRAVFLTHILGYNALNDRLLIEDVCESHGATHKGRKLGTFGLVSNFSFYYAHHMSTGEGGVVCTDDPEMYEALRMLRSHGMVRESTSAELKARYRKEHPDLNPEFIFAFPAYNVRSTELNAVLGRTQLKRLDQNNQRRTANLKLFLEGLDAKKYRTDFAVEGSCNYAFTLVLQKPDDKLMAAVERTLHDAKVEFRRGTSGGGNQLRQPYLRKLVGKDAWKKFPKVDHVHFYGMYIGNYPDLEHERIRELCKLLNGVRA